MTIFFSVGEPSGDLHGANLIRALRQRRPDARFVGFGGPVMEEAGCELLTDLTALAVMWFLRVLLNLHKFLHLASLADRYFRHQRPDAVVLIDYPGFNWWIAWRARVHGIPVFYYTPPQIWAWGRWRVKKMRRYVDHVLCSLPFEEAWFRRRGCRATFVGHPYFDEVRHHQLDREFVARMQAGEGPLVAILPGSRTQEVEANLATFLRAAEQVRQRVPNVRFAIAAFKPHQARLARAAVDRAGLNIPIFVRRTPELIHAATCCMAVSGSVSLELLYHGKPTVIVYSISRLAYRVQSWFRHTRYITLVNLLADRDPLNEATARDRYIVASDTSDTIRPTHDRQGHPLRFDAAADGTCAIDPVRGADSWTTRAAELLGDQIMYPEYLTWKDASPAVAFHISQWLVREPVRYEAERRLAVLRQIVGHGGASQRAADYIVGVLEARPEPVPRPHWPPPSKVPAATTALSDAA